MATAYVGARSDGERTTGALAIAGGSGRVDHVAPGALPAAPGPAADAAIAERSAQVGRLTAEAGVPLVAAGGSQEPWPGGPPMPSTARVGRHERRLAQVAVADALVGRLVADHPGVLVVVAGVSPASHWRLTPLAASGDRSGALWSPSTRRPGLSVLTDLAPTVLAAAGLGPADGMVGQRLSVGPEAADLSAVQDLHERTIDREGLTAGLTVSFIVLQAVVYALALLALSLRRRRRGRPPTGPPAPAARLRAAPARLALSCAAPPVVTFLYRLAPTSWQRPVVAGTLIALGSASVAALALRFRRHPLSPLVFVAGLTVAVMAVDAATSGLLQNVSLFGYTPLTAARYYGMGNLGFAVLGSSVIVLAGAWVASSPVRRDGWWAAACLFAGVTVLQVAPVMGADFGGALVLVPTGLLATAAWAGVRLTARRVVLTAVATVALVGGLVALDESFGDGSHVARFARSGPSGMWEVVQRKLDSNLHVLTTSSWSWTLVIVGLFAAGAVAALGRRTTWFAGAPAWRTTLLTLVGFGVLGGLANDSGIAIPAMVAVYVGALLLVLARRTPFSAPVVLEPAAVTPD